MKKIAFSGLMTSLFVMTGAAFADESATALTTKNYVDSGLRAVYQKASAAESAASANTSSITALQSAVNQHAELIDGLTSAIGDGESGLVADVAGLQSAMSAIESAGYLTLDDIAGKADQSALDALSSTVSGLSSAVSGKADQSAVDALSANVSGLETAVAGKASQSALDALQSQINALDTTYTGTNGVLVSGQNVGLNVTAETGKMYVYTSSGWDEIPVENTWDSSVLY